MLYIEPPQTAKDLCLTVLTQRAGLCAKQNINYQICV